MCRWENKILEWRSLGKLVKCPAPRRVCFNWILKIILVLRHKNKEGLVTRQRREYSATKLAGLPVTNSYQATRGRVKCSYTRPVRAQKFCADACVLLYLFPLFSVSPRFMFKQGAHEKWDKNHVPENLQLTFMLDVCLWATQQLQGAHE